MPSLLRSQASPIPSVLDLDSSYIYYPFYPKHALCLAFFGLYNCPHIGHSISFSLLPTTLLIFYKIWISFLFIRSFLTQRSGSFPKRNGMPWGVFNRGMIWSDLHFKNNTLISDWRESGIEAHQGRSSGSREKWINLLYIFLGINSNELDIKNKEREVSK